ncbi:MAG: tyrosine-type recombinase/integrase, partial [Bradyrhizobium sp.]
MARSYGNGNIEERDGKFRLRYRLNGKTMSKTLGGDIKTRREAREELRKLLKAKDDGVAVEPSRLTVAKWIAQWIASGAPGPKNRKEVGQRTLERYEQLLNEHVVPTLGTTALQSLQSTAIDRLYTGLEAKVAAGEMAPRTTRHVHVVFNACLGTALRTRMIAVNPMQFVARLPNPNPKPADLDDEGEADEHQEGLSETELAKLVAGFKSSSLYSFIVLAAATGARRNELLALRWTDLDLAGKTVRIERAWEHTKKFGLRLKAPKSERGFRTIGLDDATLGVLLAEMRKHQQLVAGIPDGADVDLSLVKLPPKALMFPAVPEPGQDFVLTAPRMPRNVSKEFRRRADLLGFGIKLHTLRGI